MKKNWIVIGSLLLFVILWQSFVVAPYTKKTAPKPAAPVTATSTASTSGVAVATTAPAAGTSSATELVPPRTLQQLQSGKVVSFELGNRRKVELLEGGVLANAEFADFFQKDAKDPSPIRILSQGLFWKSDNQNVQACLRSMKVLEGSAGDSYLLGADVDGGSCRLAYDPDPTHPGLVKARLTMTGFQGQEGSVELRSRDALGSTRPENQNYLAYKADDSIETIRATDLFEAKRVQAKVDWIAWGDRYFATLMIPKGSYNPDLFHSGEAEKSEAEYGLRYPLNPQKLNEPYSYELNLYMGTRDPDVLNGIDPSLVETVDLGFFASVARLMLWSLKNLNKLFNNYGVSIIALTLIVRILFWPLNKKAFTSGLAMKAVQPEIERIKSKYGNDKSKAEQMNRELLNLYKTRKVNPLGSCLPMLLQIPIFIGLYGALNHAVDLYQAPFFGWVQDLSSPDPFYVFPILWTVSLIVYMQLNPQATQTQPGMPNMKWMFIAMNVFFGFLSKDWPAGLTLYLFVSNLVGVTQQYFIQRGAKLQPIQGGA
jgi:YidC/Oxa1 family membrane protein insertase